MTMTTSPSQDLPGPHQELLVQLGHRFTAFRRSHPPRSRYPSELRRAVIDAVDAGIASSEVARACGLSPSQLWSWRKKSPASIPPASILTIVDDEAIVPSPQREAEFQFQLAGWCVRVQLMPPRSEKA